MVEDESPAPASHGVRAGGGRQRCRSRGGLPAWNSSDPKRAFDPGHSLPEGGVGGGTSGAVAGGECAGSVGASPGSGGCGAVAGRVSDPSGRALGDDGGSGTPVWDHGCGFAAREPSGSTADDAGGDGAADPGTGPLRGRSGAELGFGPTLRLFFQRAVSAWRGCWRGVGGLEQK